MSPPIQTPDHGTIAAELALLRHELRANTEETRDVKHLLTGNGEPAKGLIVRMDRVEQAKVRQDWFAGVALTAAIGAIGTTLWHKLTGRG